MADLSKVKIGGTAYDLKDAGGRTLIAAADSKIDTEIDRAKAAEGGLDTRVKNLEARGRYLSAWNVATGLPADYPEIPEGATSPYTYTFKTGDYYIVGTVPTTGTKYMPDGASITATKSGTTWTWTIGKKETTDSISTGDQYVYSTSSWTHISAAKEVSWGTIVGTLSNQTDLQNALDAKLAHKSGKSGSAGDLAYKDTASGSVTTVDSAKFTITPAGTVTLGAFTQTATDASLTTGDYTPSGTITGSAISGGSISVTLKDKDTTKEASLTRGDYTPAGSVSIAKDAAGVEISGTVSKPDVTVDDSTKDTFVKSLKAGTTDAAAFTEGAFTPAEIQTGFYTAGSDASLSTGAQASLTDQTTAKFVKKGTKFEYVNTTDDPETLVLSYVADTDTEFYNSAVTDRGTFTANTLQTLTGGKATVIDTTKFSGGSKAADTFSAEKLPIVDGTASAVTAVTAALATAPTFTGDKFAATFTGTKETDLKVTKAEYVQQAVDTASFTGTTATLGFSGTLAEDILVTGVKYDKATANGATFTGTEIADKEVTLTKTSKDVTVS